MIYQKHKNTIYHDLPMIYLCFTMTYVLPTKNGIFCNRGITPCRASKKFPRPRSLSRRFRNRPYLAYPPKKWPLSWVGKKNGSTYLQNDGFDMFRHV
jgi:hypothetical protein